MSVTPNRPPGSMYRPKGPVVDEMCARCPFKPDGSGFAVGHPDFPRIVQQVNLGLPFYCHETVIMHPDTKMVIIDGEKTPDPELGVQPHFKNCLGAVLTKQGKLPQPVIRPPFTMKRKRRK